MNRLLMSFRLRRHLPLLIRIQRQSAAAPARSALNEYDVEPGDAIKTIGIVKHLSDDELLETVQRQTFRYFWHYAHPNSGMARERSNTVRADFYLDFIDEANDEPNLAKGRSARRPARSEAPDSASWPPSSRWKETGSVAKRRWTV